MKLVLILEGSSMTLPGILVEEKSKRKGLRGEERRGRGQAKEIEEEVDCRSEGRENRNEGQEEKKEKSATDSAPQEEYMKPEQTGSRPGAN